MLIKILFTLYAGLIPIVPLMGARAYKRRGERTKLRVCMGLFALQTLISAGSIITFCEL